jgi:hypothetical protein
LQAAEAVIRAGMLQAGCGILGELLAADPGYRGPRADCGNGHEAVFVACRDKVIDTVLGPVALRRAWYHCARCKHGLAPRHAEPGVTGPSMSPGLAAMTSRAGAAVPFASAAGLLEDLAGVRLTVKRVERAAEASGAARATASRDRARLIAGRKLVPLPPQPLPDKLYAVIDGTGVPVTGKEAEGRDGKGEDGRARTREVKLAVFFTRDKVNEEGYPVRDRASSSYIATFARTLEFMLLDRKDEWLAARLEDLDHGYIDGICAAARKYPLEGVKKDEADKALHYFENNAPRMRYHWFRQCGPFVGSGVVEAGCKSVIGQRLKQAGMHWTVPGADSIIALRCAEASSQPEAVCRNQHNQTAAA